MPLPNNLWKQRDCAHTFPPPPSSPLCFCEFYLRPATAFLPLLGSGNSGANRQKPPPLFFFFFFREERSPGKKKRPPPFFSLGPCNVRDRSDGPFFFFFPLATQHLPPFAPIDQRSPLRGRSVGVVSFFADCFFSDKKALPLAGPRPKKSFFSPPPRSPLHFPLRACPFFFLQKTDGPSFFPPPKKAGRRPFFRAAWAGLGNLLFLEFPGIKPLASLFLLHGVITAHKPPPSTEPGRAFFFFFFFSLSFRGSTASRPSFPCRALSAGQLFFPPFFFLRR